MAVRGSLAGVSQQRAAHWCFPVFALCEIWVLASRWFSLCPGCHHRQHRAHKLIAPATRSKHRFLQH
jgi:hypothetical protein